MKTADLDAFVARLRAEQRHRLDSGREVYVSRAPGRLDALGGVIDYTGGAVCEMPLSSATRLALQPLGDRVLRLASLDVGAHGLAPEVTIPLDDLLIADYGTVREQLCADHATAWAAYVAGAWTVLYAEGLVDGYDGGANVVIESDVPAGAGVSSSAAIEMATLFALTAAIGLEVDPKRLAHLGQKVENQVVGAPCGLMDQLTVTLGRADALLVIRCQPDEILANRGLPPGLTLGAIHTGVKHTVGGSHYTEARVAAFMGHKILLDHLRCLGTVGAGDDPFGGYLARIPWHEFQGGYLPLLPAVMRGSDFLSVHGDTVDAVTSPEPDVSYYVASSTTHHVRENANTYRFLEALDAFERTRDIAFAEWAGELMLSGHRGYGDDMMLGAPEADLLVSMAMELGPGAGVFGGRITGGGSGGSVIFLGDSRLPGLLPGLAQEYTRRSGCTGTVLLGSSDGAAACGVESITL